MGMSMELLDQLEEYLSYMKQLGLAGLALEQNPFEAALPPVRRMQPRPSRPPATTQPGPARTQLAMFKQPPQARSKPASSMPDLLSIMATVDMIGAGGTRTQVAEVKGEDPEAIFKNLNTAFQDCQGCPLSTTRNRIVFGEGPTNATIAFVGEYPMGPDDASGRPFMDDAGQLLNKIIEAMGLTREQVFLTNVTKCAPPGRLPLPDELDACAPILERQLVVLNPRVVVSMGPTALRFFRGDGHSLLRAHGRFFQWKNTQVMPTYHPSYILRNPRAKRETWNDLQQVMTLLKEA